MTVVRAFSSSLGVGLALAASMSLARAGCSGTTTVVCTGGPGAALNYSNSTFTTHTATPYPSVLAVSGAPGGSTVATVSLTLSGYRTTSAHANGANGAHMGLLIKSPGSRKLKSMRSIGQAATDVSNLTFTIQDSGAAMPNGCDNLSVALANNATRSEERRVGKECRS